MKHLAALAAIAILILIASEAIAAPPAQEGEPAGEAYTVRAGDTLSALAKEYYSAASGYPVIVDGTNVMSLWDDSFTFILDPDRLAVGQKLWIPDSADELPPMPEFFEGLTVNELTPRLSIIDETTLKLEGNIEITADFDGYFIRFAEKHPNLKTIVVTSYGGEVLQWLNLAGWVHEKGIDLVVQDLCLSSCANYLFIAARNKTVRSGSLVAWHGDAGYAARKREPEPDLELLIQMYTEDLSEEEATELVEGFLAYDREIDQRTGALYTQAGVNPGIMMAGYADGNDAPDYFTMSQAAMESFGVTNLTIEDNITSEAQLQRIVKSIDPDLVVNLITPSNP